MSDSIVTDPLGRTIVLTDATWFGHIIKGHPDLKHFRAAVENAIRAPLQINFSKAADHCRLYYGPGRSALLVAVVCDVSRGIVKTAYSCRHPSTGEREWP